MFTPARLTRFVIAALAFDGVAILSHPTLLPAQSAAPMSAVVVDGTGAETFVLVSGMVGGVT